MNVLAFSKVTAGHTWSYLAQQPVVMFLCAARSFLQLPASEIPTRRMQFVGKRSLPSFDVSAHRGICEYSYLIMNVTKCKYGHFHLTVLFIHAFSCKLHACSRIHLDVGDTHIHM